MFRAIPSALPSLPFLTLTCVPSFPRAGGILPTLGVAFRTVRSSTHGMRILRVVIVVLFSPFSSPSCLSPFSSLFSSLSCLALSLLPSLSSPLLIHFFSLPSLSALVFIFLPPLLRSLSQRSSIFSSFPIHLLCSFSLQRSPAFLLVFDPRPFPNLFYNQVNRSDDIFECSACKKIIKSGGVACYKCKQHGPHSSVCVISLFIQCITFVYLLIFHFFSMCLIGESCQHWAAVLNGESRSHQFKC